MRAALTVTSAIAFLVAAGVLIRALWPLGAEEEIQRSGSCRRPYADWSPWNTPLDRPTYDPRSTALVATIPRPLTSDPTQYTYPVYELAGETPPANVELSGSFSDVRGDGTELANQRAGSVTVPLRADTRPASGSDGQVIVIDRRTGDEWGFWRLSRDSDGSWRATNGYHYNTRWSAVPPSSFVSRGAGVPYLAGLVRPCEIDRGRIDHALAFAYPYPSPDFVHPATKSDGIGKSGEDLPEGSRLQLDPALTDDAIRSWGCSDACLTIAKALQRYGMYVIDNGGRAKVMLEYDGTARWHGDVKASTPSPIPLRYLRLVRDTVPSLYALPSSGTRTSVRLRYRVFDGGAATRETVWVTVRGRRIATLMQEFHRPLQKRASWVEWQPARTGRFEFCVLTRDPAGNASGPSCAAVVVR